MAVWRAVLSLGVGLFAVAVALTVWATYTFVALDVRAAMDRCRKRIEGEGYATDTKSEGYTKYHKKLTAKFKEVSVFLGADKPSALPEDKRSQFIEEVDKLDLMEDGTIDKPLPF